MTDLTPLTPDTPFLRPGLPYDEWVQIGRQLGAMVRLSPFLVGKWLIYGEDAYGERFSQALAVTGLDDQTLYNYASVTRRVPDPRPTLSFSHHAEVAALPAPAQADLLAEAEAEGLTVKALRERVRERKHAVLPAPVLPAGVYDLLYADPPWRYDDGSADESRVIENHYPTLALDELCALPVPRLAAADAALYLWCPAGKYAEAVQVMAAWGFTPRSSLVWVKVKSAVAADARVPLYDAVVTGMGYWARVAHELVLVGRKGNFPPPPASLRPSSVIFAPRRDHSRKPDEMAAEIERMYPRARRIELFARTARPNWAFWGNAAALAS